MLIKTETEPTRSEGYSAEMELLRKSGAIGSNGGIEESFVEAMQVVGLDPGNLLTRLAMIVEGAESDAVKLQAIKFATQLYMHKALVPPRSSDTPQMPAITFVFTNPPPRDGNEINGINLQQILVPSKG